MTEDPTYKKSDSACSTSFVFWCLYSVFFPVLSMDPFNPLSRPEYLLLLLEQGEISLEGHTRLFLEITHLTTYPDNPHEMALERILPPSWSGYWRETDLRSPSLLRKISVPLRTQSPAHHHLAAQSLCPSPPMTESQTCCDR